jgi:hypothetical protein
VIVAVEGPTRESPGRPRCAGGTNRKEQHDQTERLRLADGNPGSRSRGRTRRIGRPTFERVDVDETFADEFLTPACGVPVTTHAQGHLIFRTFGRERTGTAALTTLNVALTATAGDNTYKFRDVGADHVQIKPDGSDPDDRRSGPVRVHGRAEDRPRDRRHDPRTTPQPRRTPRRGLCGANRVTSARREVCRRARSPSAQVRSRNSGDRSRRSRRLALSPERA